MSSCTKKAGWTKGYKEFITNIFPAIFVIIKLTCKHTSIWNESAEEIKINEKFRCYRCKKRKSRVPKGLHGHFNEVLEHHSKIRSALWWAGNRSDSIWKRRWRQHSEIRLFGLTKHKSLKAPHRSFWLRRRHTKETNSLKKRVHIQ